MFIALLSLKFTIEEAELNGKMKVFLRSSPAPLLSELNNIFD